jgi:hypothetical protein
VALAIVELQLVLLASSEARISNTKTTFCLILLSNNFDFEDLAKKIIAGIIVIPKIARNHVTVPFFHLDSFSRVVHQSLSV